MQNQSMMEKASGKKTAVSQWGGLSLIVLGGVVFLLSVLNISFENWWALFILLPALAMFGGGLAFPRKENGHFDHAQYQRFSFASRLFFGLGLVPLVVAGMFLLNLDWSVWWPLMIVTPGLSLLIATGRNSENPIANAWIGFFRWVSATMLGLGGVFLAYTFGFTDLEGFGQLQWWGVFIAFPAIGALLNGVRLSGRVGLMNGSVLTLLFIALMMGITAVIELLGISWTHYFGITAVFFIGCGIILLWNGLRSTSE